ncbi:uncharacterized protein LOC123310070 isoform X2 [Coccinella septempunctata]|uniref:uncharacterized protein LOC123310070 isoform X2 n=1 Tax=Coccinella septempunctata TaxID=41139 RepID=UPI001D098C78|nr:uncharacterized protein LOC123310070 isoform X2 [Coccinella septempunctata]
MSRHRDIRNMDYSEDYDGYDDVYGHSVDDDIYISPSHRQFMYNRESSGQSKSDFPMEEDIQEEDETDEVVKLSEEDRAKLESCLDHVRSVFAPMRMSRPEIVKVIISQKFDCERIINHLLKSQSSPPTERRDKDETILLCNPSHLFCNSIDMNKQTISQSVEPQSHTNHVLSSKLNTLKNFKSRCKSNTQYPKTKLSLECPSPSTSNICNISSGSDRRNGTIEASDLKNTFLSKMKLKQNSDQNSDGSGSETAKEPPLVSSFLSKVNFKAKDSMEKSTPEISFLSKISKCGNDMQASTKNSISKPVITDNSERNFLDPIKRNGEIKTDLEPNILNNISKNFMSKVSLNSNGMKNLDNDKLNIFLSRIEPKGSSNKLEQTKSDISLSTLKPQSSSNNFSNLKLVEVKSVPLLRNKENDIFNINLTSALQKNNLEKLKFRPLPEGEQFDIPFVGNDEMEEEEEMLECTMDLSHLATKRVLYYQKKPSVLGRMFCLRYKIPNVHPYRKKKISLDPKLVKFNFSEPSPDDRIKKHIKRNL